MRGLAVFVLCALAAFLGWGWGRGSAVRGEVVRTDTVRVAPADYEAAKNGEALWRGEALGLRERIRGLEERQPERIIVVDSVPVTDTVWLAIDKGGRLAYQFLPAGFDGPVELRTDIDVADCDDGIQIRDRQVICDNPRAGHLWVGVEASRHPSVFLAWRPNYRSPWDVSVSFDGSRWDFGVRRGLRLW